MIKRLLLIAIILGLGQVFMIFSLKIISQILSAETFSLFGQIEAKFQLLIIIMAAGILSDAIRKIAQTTEWKPGYLQYQSARFFWSLLLCPLAFLFFLDKSFLIFLIAPIIALSGEYAFYGVGKPVLGALISLIRILIPYGVSLVVASFIPHYFLEVFILLLFLTYFLTGFMIARLLNTPFIISPSIKAFRLYLTSLNLGFVNILLYVQGLGMMIFIPLLFFENFQVISVAFIGLKFYTIFKSIIRIIHQAFVREMIHLDQCFIIDKLSMIIGFIFLAAILIFPVSTITLLFGNKFMYAVPFFQMMALSCLVFSFCFSLATNAVLVHFDRKLLLICIISALLCISALFIFSWLLAPMYVLGYALLIGDVSLSIGLLYLYHPQNMLKERIYFLIQNGLVFLVPLLLKFFFFSDSLTGLLICLFCYSFILFILNLKEFNSVKLKKLDY